MKTAFDAFEDSLGRVRSLHTLHAAFSRQVTAAVDLSDVLRAEVVLAVSALDYYIHELTRLGMLESWTGKRKRTEAFERFSLPMSVTAGLKDELKAESLLEAEIRLRHSFLAFQHPDRIADAVRLISDVKLWDLVGKKLGMDAKSVKAELLLIVDRRNKIAHEADVDPSYPGQYWPISRAIVEAILDKLEQIAKAIFEVAA